MKNTTLFQYCQKLVILSEDRTKVLLARRKGEADYNEVFAFIGGKMETTDESLVAAMKREKEEEIGSEARVKVFSEETYNVFFQKQDGTAMILPHIAGVFISGEIQLSNEYSEYAWVSVEGLDDFEPKIQNILKITKWALRKLSEPGGKLIEI
jgi:8-oxo-dGTP pyrophosphatase MutT (NUDIX family)